MKASVVQYLRPNGKTMLGTVEIGDEYEEAYRRMEGNGLRLESEVLTTGEVAITISDMCRGEDVDIEVVTNGPEVITAIETLLARYAERGGSDDE
jgi:pyruvate formate-lyase activating enzyme-like uncharacterized protein